MSENQPQKIQNGSGPMARITLLSQYVRDLSFENPGAPNPAANNPAINVTIKLGTKKHGGENHEVSLQVRLEAQIEDKPHFIIDIKYCGLFQLDNVPEKEIQRALLIEGPRVLFPFLRRIVADVARDGGYPSIMLDPMDFASIYRQGMQENQRGQGLVDPEQITEEALGNALERAKTQKKTEGKAENASNKKKPKKSE